jgi:hypothetical protein
VRSGSDHSGEGRSRYLGKKSVAAFRTSNPTRGE